MRQKNGNNKYTLVGKNIYRDKNGNAIYMKKNNRYAYVIRMEQEGMFQTLLLRYYVAILVGFLFYYTFFENIILSIVISVVLFCLMEYKFRNILKNNVKIEKNSISKFDLVKEDSIGHYKNESNGILIAKAGFFIIIGLLLIINSFISYEINSSKIAMFGTYLAAIIAFYFGYRIICIFNIKNRDKQIRK